MGKKKGTLHNAPQKRSNRYRKNGRGKSPTEPRIRVSWCFASEIAAKASVPLEADDQSPLAVAIRLAWPDSHPVQYAMIARRYRELYEGLTESEAVKAVRAGYSSSSAAIGDGLIEEKPYVGFRRTRSQNKSKPE